MSEWFDELAEGLEPPERDRLRTVHEQLVQAGPPAELPAALATLPADVAPARTIPFPPARRRVAAVLVLAAALAAAVFGGGYLVGDRNHGSGALEPVRAMTLSGHGAVASLRVGGPDADGNWPGEFSVRGLPPTGEHGYYELFVLRHGKPGFPCAGFKVGGETTKVTFTVPYDVRSTTRWVVTAIDRDHEWPGRVVMS